MEVSTILPYLTLAGGIRVISSNAGSVFKGLGRPRLSFLIHLTNVILIYGITIPLVIADRSLESVALGVMLGLLGTLPFIVYNLTKVLAFAPGRLLQSLAPGAVLGGVVTLAVFLCQRFEISALIQRIAAERGAAFDPALANALFTVSASMVAAGGLYLFASLVLWRGMGVGPFRVIEMVRKSRKGKSKAQLAMTSV
jgi:hypothetical protein